MGIDTFEAQIPHHPDKIKILPTAGTLRKHPNIPTFRELGFPEIQGVAWNSLVVPAKTPVEVVEKLSNAVVAALKSPDVSSKIREKGWRPLQSLAYAALLVTLVFLLFSHALGMHLPVWPWFLNRVV